MFRTGWSQSFETRALRATHGPVATATVPLVASSSCHAVASTLHGDTPSRHHKPTTTTTTTTTTDTLIPRSASTRKTASKLVSRPHRHRHNAIRLVLVVMRRRLHRAAMAHRFGCCLEHVGAVIAILHPRHEGRCGTHTERDSRVGCVVKEGVARNGRDAACPRAHLGSLWDRARRPRTA
jgi:hypothetical protein